MLNPDRGRRDPGGPDLERHRFWRGQHLESRDVNDVGAGQEERQWWHNRAVHDAYGVVAGLAVQPGTAAQPGVRVQPGLAYDSYGREIVLADDAGGRSTANRRPRSEGDVGAPAARPGRRRLRVRRRQGSEPCRARLATRGSGRIADGVALVRGVWVPEGEGLVFRADAGFSPLPGATLRPAPPGPRPHLSWRRPRGGRGRRSWGRPERSDRLVTTARGIEVTIDTSAAGFTRTPCYFAWLHGGLWQVPHRLALTVPLSRITREARDQLTFSLWDPTAVGTAVITGAVSDAAAAAIARLLSLARQRLYVCWLGVETDRHAALSSAHGAAGLERARKR